MLILFLVLDQFFSSHHTFYIMYTNLELLNLNTCNSLKFLNVLPSFEKVAEVSKFSDMQSNEVDLNMAYQADRSYYKVKDIQKQNLDRNLNIFHTNINGLETKMKNPHEFLTNTSTTIDVIAITATFKINDDCFEIIELKIHNDNFAM